jgi:hypothetical protein
MRSALSIVFVGLSSLVLVACGDSGAGDSRGTGGSGGVTLDCTTLTNPPPDCQKSCTSDSQCEASFCSNSSCVALCTPEPAEGCGENSTCNSRGRCVPNIGTGGTGGSGNTGGSGCQSIQVTPTRSIPNVMFLVDQSGSMTTGFGGGMNRWQAAHSAINAIVSDPLDDIVRFGLTTYTSRNGNQNPSCPRLPTQISFDLDNSSDFGDDKIYPYSYPSGDGEDTPTGDSIDALVGLIQADPPPNDGPTIIVLATDGLPDSCECADNYPDPIDNNNEYCVSGATDPQIEAVNAATAAHTQGIDVFALWVGDLDDNPNDPTRRHMQDVANAGIGGTGAVYVGDDPTSLSGAFQSIISDSISCDVQIDKPFDNVEKACNEGDVRLNDTPLSCVYGQPGMSDWQVQGNDIIRLLGSACDTFKSGSSTFSAVFPCGAIIVE